MEDRDVAAYLERIGAERPPGADLASLHDLQLRHLLTVPFENLAIHLGEGVSLDEAALFDKVVRRRRGGFCYELNGLFAALLKGLGYSVTLLAARAVGKAGIGPPFDHLALRVDAAAPWLVDVGWGRFAHHPLRLAERGEQRDPGGTFRIVESGHGDLDVLMNGEPQYRIEPRPRRLADFEATCWWHQTSPKSHFTQSLVCSLLTETGRVTLTGRSEIVTDGGGRRERTLDGDEEVLDAYRSRFGIELDRVPTLRGGAAG